MAQHHEKTAVPAALKAIGGILKDTVTGYPQHFNEMYAPVRQSLKNVGGILKDTVADYPQHFNEMYAPVQQRFYDRFAPVGQSLKDVGGILKDTATGYPRQLYNTFAEHVPGAVAKYGPVDAPKDATEEWLRTWARRGAATAIGAGGAAAGLAAGAAALPGMAASRLYALGGTTFGQTVQRLAAYGAVAGGGLGAVKGYQAYNSPTPEQQATAAVAAEKLKKDVNVATGNQLLINGALGLGIGGGATALYYYMHRRRKQQEEKRRLEHAQLLEKGDLKFAGVKEDLSALWSQYVAEPIGGLGQSAATPNIPGLSGEERKPVLGGMRQGGALLAVPLIAGAAGLYGAHQFMRAREKQVDVDQAADNVIAAKKDYMRALSGDKAASLDAAYEKYAAQSKTAVTDPNTPAQWSNLTEWIGQNLYATGLLSGAAGLGVGAHFMYHKTKKDLANNNLATAAETRARLRALPAPWIDPAELSALQQQLRESKS